MDVFNSILESALLEGTYNFFASGFFNFHIFQLNWSHHGFRNACIRTTRICALRFRFCLRCMAFLYQKTKENVGFLSPILQLFAFLAVFAFICIFPGFLHCIIWSPFAFLPSPPLLGATWVLFCKCRRRSE